MTDDKRCGTCRWRQPFYPPFNNNLCCTVKVPVWALGAYQYHNDDYRPHRVDERDGITCNAWQQKEGENDRA